jgi:DNA-binding HxlR family transcriptional regulator
MRSAPIEESIHLRLAYGLVAEKGDLRRGIMLELIGRPRRYAEFKFLLKGRRDHNLTVALTRLQRDGLVDRRTNARERRVVHAYELTPLGIQAVLAMQSIRPVHEAVEAYHKGRNSSARL